LRKGYSNDGFICNSKTPKTGNFRTIYTLYNCKRIKNGWRITCLKAQGTRSIDTQN
jgi:hypothetical protein